MNNYTEVPNIISCKDLDYLSDMFNWNYGAYKSSYSASNIVKNEELKRVIDKAINVFHSNMVKVLDILKGE